MERQREILLAKREALLRQLERNNHKLQSALHLLDNQNAHDEDQMISTRIFAWSPDGRRILLKQPDTKTILLHDLKSKKTHPLPSTLHSMPVILAKFLTATRYVLGTADTIVIYEAEEAMQKYPLSSPLVDCNENYAVCRDDLDDGMKAYELPSLNPLVHAHNIKISGRFLTCHLPSGIQIITRGIVVRRFQGLAMTILNVLQVDNDLFLLGISADQKISLYHSEADNLLIQVADVSLPSPPLDYCISGSTMFILHPTSVSVVSLKDLKIAYSVQLTTMTILEGSRIIAPTRNPSCFAIESGSSRYFFRFK